MKMIREKMLEDNTTLMWKLCDGDIKNVNGKVVFDAVDKGDVAAKDVLDTYIDYLATGVVNIVNIFQPDVLTIGGGVSKQGENLLAPVREILEREQYSRFSDKKTILKAAELGNDAGIIGAASLGK
jgi:glucokinase